ncbi:glycosyltransferase family 2 protein [Citreicella sp. C3M06]|uniref:glycosyltransferase family 2 protein n=1 Tax=Citreicella sp. C3M06 TaxID=2841564 RepID=UPI001C0A3B23|nr:glycosyltransferase family 2 protein [Citreicella sp. C3M06]MBU2963179.1 glycosyltransferase family 2 protein [Citreicella sp. C3M06]
MKDYAAPVAGDYADGLGLLDAFAGRARRAEPDPQIAVILPCHNEAAAIAQTVQQFRAALPQARIYVYDNNSTDDTARIARDAGAIVRFEPRKGKGNVVRRMFADVEADIYVMADGDATYHAASAPAMISMLMDGKLDMVNGARISTDAAAYRAGHKFGNRLLSGLVQTLFARDFNDMLSGYRVFSRRFVKSFPALSQGFEIETELTVHSLQLRMPAGEVPTPYSARPENSNSKLSTYRDGWRILRMIGLLVKEEKPLQFFAGLAGLMALPSLAVFASIFAEFMETGLVARFPSLFVSLTGIGLAALSLVCAVILETVARGRREARYMTYLQIPGPRG